MSSSDDDDFMLWQILRRRRLRRRSGEFAAVWLKEEVLGTADDHSRDIPLFEVAKNSAKVKEERHQTLANEIIIKTELSDLEENTSEKTPLVFAEYDAVISLPEYLEDLLSDRETDPTQICDHGCAREECLSCLSVDCAIGNQRSVDQEASISVQDGLTRPKRSLRCAQCDKEFSHRSALVLHLRSHAVSNRRQADLAHSEVNRSQLMTSLRQRRHRARMTAEQRLLMRQKNAERQRRRRAKMNGEQ